MAYYCGECIVWLGSSDVDRYGRRWCSYDRKYRESNQNTYGCGGFVYVGRVILTEVCDALHLPPCAMFAAYDAAKAHAVEPEHTAWLADYSKIGTQIVACMRADAERIHIAEQLTSQYISPAMHLCSEERWDEAVSVYRSMVHAIAERYHIQ